VMYNRRTFVRAIAHYARRPTEQGEGRGSGRPRAGRRGGVASHFRLFADDEMEETGVSRTPNQEEGPLCLPEGEEKV